jgi:hypothetical protein
MQNRQRCSRFCVVNSAYADLPRPVHWALNSLGAFSLAAPHVFSLLSWFLLTWSIDMLQAAFGMARAGAIFALFDMLKLGTSLFVLILALDLWSSRAEWSEIVYEIVDDSSEDFVRLLRR